ncbi:Zinc finger MYND domain-containing protein 10 [Balamuthia mandrillaris]
MTSWLASLPPITIDLPAPVGIRVPLLPVLQQDGFRRLGVVLYYSDHEGLEALIPAAKSFFDYIEDDEEALSAAARMVLNTRDCINWGIGTEPVYDDTARAALGPLEVLWNVEKHSHSLEALLAIGAVEDTGRRANVTNHVVRLCKLLPPPPMSNCPEEEEEKENAEQKEEEGKKEKGREKRKPRYRCAECAAEGVTARCSACGARYCDRTCQKKAWPWHKPLCKLIAESNK